MNTVLFQRSPNPTIQLPPDPEGQSPTRSYGDEILRSFRMHRVLALSIGLVTSLLLIGFALSRHPYYETSALVYVQPMKAKLMTDPSDGTYDQTRYETNIQQQLQTIRRTDVLTAALKLAASRAGYDIWTLPGESEQSAVARLHKDLKVEREMGSYQLSISLSGSNPFAITTLVNAVLDSYIAMEPLDEMAQSDRQLQALMNERPRLLEDLNKSEQEQADVSTSLGFSGLAGSDGAPANPYDAQLNELRTQLASAQAAHTIAEARLSSITQQDAASSTALDAAGEAKYATDPELATMKQMVSQRRGILATQMAGLTPKNPLYKQDQDELRRLGESLDSMSTELRKKAAAQMLGELRFEDKQTEDIVARLAGQLQQQAAAATGATPKLQRASFLAANVARLQSRLTDVDNAISALQLEHSSSSMVHPLLRAEQPMKPLASKKLFILAAALPIGCLFGLMAAFFLHSKDPKIYIGSDVEAILKFPPMAVLPNPEQVAGRVLDEFTLRLVAGIDQAYSIGGARAFVFTSVSVGADISEFVSSVATKMEHLGYRIVILKASDVLERLSLGEKSSAVRAESRLAKAGGDALAPPRRENFVAENLEKMKQNVDLLFIEALPILSSAEAEFTARLADVTVLVASSAQTTKKELANSLSLARRLNVHGIAAVLRNVDLRNADDDLSAVIAQAESRQAKINRTDLSTTPAYASRYLRSLYEESVSAGADPNISEQ